MHPPGWKQITTPMTNWIQPCIESERIQKMLLLTQHLDMLETHHVWTKYMKVQKKCRRITEIYALVCALVLALSSDQRCYSRSGPCQTKVWPVFFFWGASHCSTLSFPFCHWPVLLYYIPPRQAIRAWPNIFPGRSPGPCLSTYVEWIWALLVQLFNHQRS